MFKIRKMTLLDAEKNPVFKRKKKKPSVLAIYPTATPNLLPSWQSAYITLGAHTFPMCLRRMTLFLDLEANSEILKAIRCS